MACTSKPTRRYSSIASGTHPAHQHAFGPQWPAAICGALGIALLLVAPSSSAATNTATPPHPCKGTVYLTIDTGSMSQAENIARTLNKYHVRATFFLANEKTINGDYSLDDSWRTFWQARVAEGHSFGTHTFDHVYFRDGDRGPISMGKRSQGPRSGVRETFDESAFCGELQRVNTRFQQLTGKTLQPIWRAPGGYTTSNTLRWAKTCGFRHIGWTPAGFLGDELPSEKYSNETLLKRGLANIGNGDILVMHTGIWSRHEPFAPMLDPLIDGLQKRGLCFATITE